MKKIEDWVDDIEDIAAQEMECSHSVDWDGVGRSWDNAEYNLSERGRLLVAEKLTEFEQEISANIYDRCLEIARSK